MSDMASRILQALAPLSREELESFIATQPIYAKLNSQLPEYVNHVAPRVVFIYCERCKAKLPFRALSDDIWFNPVHTRHVQQRGPNAVGLRPRITGTYEFFFKCSGCDETEFITWVRFDYENNFIRKLGQSIPWSIDIGRELERDLGEDAALYKKALILLSQSYGIGACAYLRRIIENQINPLLQLLYDITKQDGADGDQLNRISTAIQKKEFTTKIETAVNILPESIMVDGSNPVKLMHEQFSKSIHALEEEEAIQIAIGLKSAFEYLAVELNRQQRSKKQFAETIRGVNKSST